MENQRNFLFITMMVLGAILYMKWIDFSTPEAPTSAPIQSEVPSATASNRVVDTAEVPDLTEEVPAVAPAQIPAAPIAVNADLIKIETDLIKASINPTGGVIEWLELLDEPISVEQPEQGFPLLKNTPAERFVAQDGLLARGLPTPNHANTVYGSAKKSYSLDSAETLRVPLIWVAENGIEFIKTYVFRRDSYVVEIEYQVNNRSTAAWEGAIYAQFLSTEPTNTGGGFGQLPSYTGAAFYTEEEKYEKIKFKDMRGEKYDRRTDAGWVAMLQHYFVGAWIPGDGPKSFYTATNQNQSPPSYRVGYSDQRLTRVEAGASGTLKTSVYLGSKEQRRLKAVQQEKGITGLALTVDYGFLTFIADPLFSVLSWIHSIVGNWGWAIILLTILIKLVFYPLSAASYKSMAGMKKLQPRIQTLKERYKDDRQKFQMEMMALYKKEKINPAGGCLPILVQIPVFIALYWVLLESVEMRQAPFALWLQDLSAPDPYFILPVLMGLSMWAQQKLNPAPMEDIQKKVMMAMPIVLTFLFLTFPQGLVLYWVVNNVLSMAQQWFINKRLAV